MRISDWSSDVCSSDLPETAIVEFFANAVDTQRVRIEHDAVFGVLSEDVPECRQHRGFARVTETKKIKIARPAVRIVEPAHHQHRAFQHEADRKSTRLNSSH